MNMKYSPLIFALVLTAGLLTVQARPPVDCGYGPHCRPELWGIEPAYCVGHFNLCPRRDRTVFRYDISDCLNAGKVRRATLTLSGQVVGYFDEHIIQLERFLSEHLVLGEYDLISNDVKVCAVHKLSANPFRMEVDITDEINAVLREGASSITFRLTDPYVEKLGNRKGNAECIMIADKTLLEMEIQL